MAVAAPTSWPALPAGAAYIVLNDAARRNVLSRATLLSLRAQLLAYNTSPRSGRVLLLPAFAPRVLADLEASRIPSPASSSSASSSTSSPAQATSDLSWLTNAQHWQSERAGLPDVLVLRSAGPVFSAGHDLQELQHDGSPAADAEMLSLFALCADVMHLLRRVPVPVLARVQGLATAAGAQLALSADLVVAAAKAPFRLPGAATGFPCTSPVTAVSRRVGHAWGYRMLALAEPVRAEDLPRSAGVDVVGGEAEAEQSEGETDTHVRESTLDALDARVHATVQRLTRSAARPQALAKWAFWTQAELNGSSGGGDGGDGSSCVDGYAAALDLSGRVMALLHVPSEEGQVGIRAFVERKGRAKL